MSLPSYLSECLYVGALHTLDSVVPLTNVTGNISKIKVKWWFTNRAQGGYGDNYTSLFHSLNAQPFQYYTNWASYWDSYSWSITVEGNQTNVFAGAQVGERQIINTEFDFANKTYLMTKDEDGTTILSKVLPTSFTSNYVTFSTNDMLALFGWVSSDHTSFITTAYSRNASYDIRIYDIEFYDTNDNLIYHIIPVFNINTSKYGFYEVINGDEYYILSGSDLYGVLAPIPQTVTISDNGNGTTTPTPGTYTYQTYDTVAITAVADQGYYVNAITVDGVAQTITKGTTVTTNIEVTGDIAIAVDYQPLTVTITNGDHGSSNPPTGVYTNYEYGDTLTLTATADNQYYVKSIKVNGTAQSITKDATVSITLTLTQSVIIEIEYSDEGLLYVKSENGVFYYSNNYFDGASVDLSIFTELDNPQFLRALPANIYAIRPHESCTEINVTNVWHDEVIGMFGVSSHASGGYANKNTVQIIDASKFHLTNLIGNCFASYLPALIEIILPKFDAYTLYGGISVAYEDYAFKGSGSNAFSTLSVKCADKSVNRMAYLFSTTNYKEIDLSELQYDSIINLNNAFSSNPNLTTIYVSRDLYKAGVTTNTNNTFNNTTNIVGGEGTTYSTNYGTHAIIDNGENYGYLTYKITNDRLDCIIVEGEGLISKSTSGTIDTVEITPATGYMLNRAELYDERGNKVATYTSTNITVTRTSQGTWTLLVYLVEEGYNPYNPGAEDDETIIEYVEGLESDIIMPDYPSDYIEQWITGGFYKIFIPSVAQLQSFISVLYSQTFQDSLKNLWNNVLNLYDLILGAHIMPSGASLDGTVSPKVGWISTGADPMNYTNQQYIDKNLGSITIPRAWNNYIDFPPYTKVKIYLPFIGERELDPNIVMGKTINIRYNMDLISGDCVARLMINNSCLYQYSGNCAYKIPISNVDMSNLAMSSLKVLGGAVMAGASVITANPTIGAIGTSMITDEITKPIDGPQQIAPQVQGVDGLVSNGAYMGVNYPFVTITRTVPDIPTKYGHYVGYKCNKTLSLSSLTGYTSVLDIDLSDISCTLEEQDEIKNLLFKGVIL